MTTTSMDTSEALFELTLLNAEKSDSSFEDFFIWGTEKGIPIEVLTRLKSIWDFTKPIAGEVVSVGKIIVTAIADFLKANKQMLLGLALGAAVAALIASVPILGPLLAPVATVISTVYGAGVGAALEDGEKTSDATNPMVAAITLAKKFMELLITIFQAVSAYWSDNEANTA